jgi:hypothetical protein
MQHFFYFLLLYLSHAPAEIGSKLRAAVRAFGGEFVRILAVESACPQLRSVGIREQHVCSLGRTTSGGIMERQEACPVGS